MPPVEKPYAESCDQNREPILAVLAPLLRPRRRLLEIGSGTGQHAVYCAAALPHVTWQCSDRAEYLAGIRLWIAEAGLSNLPPPLELDVLKFWPTERFEAIFSANTAHIMGLDAVEAMFAGVGAHLESGGVFALYGPFSRDGRHTSPSNARFDAWLRTQDPAMGVRDQRRLEPFAAAHGLQLVAEYAMPVNNFTLVWERN
jgi:cyclopropane fatty-acyl-phospholipid synthase-like methyltransferase